MRIQFLSQACSGRQAAEDHIRDVYNDVYGAQVTSFAPVLVAASRADGEILCAAGIRTAAEGFFSDAYLGKDFSSALLAQTGHCIPAHKIMEVVSLASKTPFPVLPMLDRMIDWGRAQGMTCGVFTATAPLRKLLHRTGLQYVSLCSADPARLANAEVWGRYYQTDPWVCAVSENQFRHPALSPRTRKVLKIS
jgi:hypothetical protein